MAIAFIGLGSNLGDRQKNLTTALERLSRLGSTKIVQSSGWMEAAPAGGPPQGMFLNGVAQIETRLAPQRLLGTLQEIEQNLGRPKAHPPLSARIIDLDLLSYDQRILQEPDLILPHPRMQERIFVLAPLSEIAPDWTHPVLKKSAAELLEILVHGNR